MSSNPHYEADQSAVGHEVNPDGKIVYRFYPRGLSIIWGSDDRYWKIDQDKKSPADLVQVSWLEVTGKTPPLKKGTYQISFKLTLKQGASGWGGHPVFLMAKVGKKGKYKWQKLSMSELDLEQGERNVPDNFLMVVPDDSEIYFGLYEVWSGRWKKGLLIHEATVQKI